MHVYPGLGAPLRYYNQQECDLYPIGAHAENAGADSLPLMVRELAMMDVIDKITDKPGWHKKVFDDFIVAKWQQEALAIPDAELYKLATSGKLDSDEPTPSKQIPDSIINEQTFETCVRELRSKARYFEQTGIIPTLDACASIAKSDTIVTRMLHDALRDAFDKLRADQESSPDWHPNSGDMVQDLVHPSMYPLVYGHTLVFKEECVGVDDAVRAWAGKGVVIPKEPTRLEGEQTNQWNRNVGHSIPRDYWSEDYQWLPARVALQDNGGVRFTSYINNLHPNKFPAIYNTIEKLVEASLPLWDQCLALETHDCGKIGAGRWAPRRALPDDPDDECNDNWDPNNPGACAHIPVSDEDLESRGWFGDPEDESFKNEYRWKFLRKPVLPEFPFSDISYAPEAGTRLIERFRESGLQIIVKMASIELTPEKPDFPVGGWHIEGQMNEHICGTALYYLDSDNITDTTLSFRMQTSSYLNQDDDYIVNQNSYRWMERAFGTRLQNHSSPCLQNYGNVVTREGRLLAFPNVFQHRVSPFRLIDPSKKGHRRFIALWLVDPTKRIISTANVPPQQMTWFTDSVLGTHRKEALSKLPAELVSLLHVKGLTSDDAAKLEEKAKLPAELLDMVKEHFGPERQHLPMGVEEARDHRERLMQERSAYVKTSEDEWYDQHYSFCEH